MASPVTGTTLRRQRLLKDIQELVKKPYPGISLHVSDENLDSACLVLAPQGLRSLHLTMTFGDQYPTAPPRVRMDSANVRHPNVFGSYICATILNDPQFFTPAYTLKGIAIQLLSFFVSDKIEQVGGTTNFDLRRFRATLQGAGDDSWANLDARLNSSGYSGPHECSRCNFSDRRVAREQASLRLPRDVVGANFTKNGSATNGTSREGVSRRSRRRAARFAALEGLEDDKSEAGSEKAASETAVSVAGSSGSRFPIERLTPELLLAVLDKLDEVEDLINFARAWPGLGAFITTHNVIRERELQCFVLKENYVTQKLGVGVAVVSRGGALASEFDLLSEHAFKTLAVRQSVHNIPFDEWLPLPIAEPHWMSVRQEAKDALTNLKPYLKAQNPTNIEVIYSFMTDIVVRLNDVHPEGSPLARRASRGDHGGTLRHASEKAIESYFHLFHLLVCLAVEDETYVRAANRLINNFLHGKRSKEDCPNLGHLVIALLISDVPVTEELMKAIITEAVTRNVVWLLDAKGANLPGLAYMEPEAVSDYRLKRTFQGSRTSYRLLMFSELFRRAARPNRSQSLVDLRRELFQRRGGPPPGEAKRLAAEIRRLHDIDSFYPFLREMGIVNMPSAAAFTDVLRKTMRSSVTSGYSSMPLSQEEAFVLRAADEPAVGRSPHVAQVDPATVVMKTHRVSFFPQHGPAGRGGRNVPTPPRGGMQQGRGGFGRGQRGRGRGYPSAFHSHH